MANNSTPRLDLSKPRYDQSVFSGRLRHFMETANPLNVLVPSKRLEDAAKLVTEYRLHGTAPPGTSEEQLWKAKRLYDSAYHPDTGKKMFVVGRMSAQVPMNMTIVGCMMTFHRSPGAIIFWQWVNQSFNAIVNHTNRSGDEEISARQLMVPYAAATTAATVTALGLNEVAKRLPSLIGRFVPFAAVAAANSINIPLMRQKELQAGIPIVDESGKKVGMSKAAAKKAITQVILSRIFMAMPAMVIPPFIMNNLEKRGILTRMPWINAPTQIALVGLCLVFATPFCCALFPQMSSISVSKLEEGVKKDLDPALLRVYYNKGL